MNAYCEIHSGKGQLVKRERLDSMAVSDIVNKESWREIHAYQKVKPAQISNTSVAVVPVQVTQITAALAAASIPAAVIKTVLKEVKKSTNKAEIEKLKASKAMKEDALSGAQDDNNNDDDYDNDDDVDDDMLRDTDESKSDSESDGNSDSER